MKMAVGQGAGWLGALPEVVVGVWVTPHGMAALDKIAVFFPQLIFPEARGFSYPE